MELLVGLGDSRARYRDKYLPYRLPGTLRRWLADAIGPGRVVTGGFAWRGSLRRRNFDHLTVQLHFDIEDATVAFDPAWPPLEDFAGRLVIDDTRVSAWGERGELGGHRVERLSAEAWRGEAGERVLAVAATLAGDAGDGLAVVKASPLAAMTGNVVEGWSAAGPVRTALDLRIPLDGRSEPVVAVDATADGALLRVQPGGLLFEDIAGRVRYASGRGFSSDDLAGTLWGSPVSASLSQADAGAPLALRFAGKGLPMTALFEWLQLDVPALASGEADAFGDLLLRRGEPARLTLASDLAGVALALPPPWGKDAGAPRSLAMELALARDAVTIDLALGDRLAGRLTVADGAPRGGSLRLEADWLQGALDLGGPVPRLLLDYLDLAGLPGGDGGADFDAAYRALRPLAIDILELRRDGERIGHLAFELDRDAEAIVARGIRGELFGLKSLGEEGGVLRWAGGEGDAGATQFAIDVAFDDLGQVLVALGYAPTLVTDNGSASADLRWPGGPSALALGTLEGSVAVEARDGRVLEAKGSAGALKVLSLLNLAEILRGLSLSHMFESGIPFDRAASELRFRSGTVELPALTLRGAASAFEFSGVTRLAAAEPSVEGELVVTLPVANNLPWVAALAGGLPVAAGVYVVSKVFEKQVKRMSSGVYEVSGPLGSPQVRLRRIFDDSASTPVDPNGEAVADPNAAGAVKAAEATEATEATEALEAAPAGAAAEAPAGGSDPR
jgi:uncharacterized protein YhdP